MIVCGTPRNFSEVSEVKVMIDLSRRTFLAAAGSAVTLPAAALAAPDRPLVDPVQLSDADLLEKHMVEIEKILARMHPEAERQFHWIGTQEDGTYQGYFGCHRPWIPWTGPGLYRVSESGCLLDFWVEFHPESRLYGAHYEMIMWWEGKYIDRHRPRRRQEAFIVTKLEGPSPYEGA